MHCFIELPQLTVISCVQEWHVMDFFLPVGDPVSRWWAVVLKAAVYWLQGDDVAVRALLAEAERMPRALHILE